MHCSSCHLLCVLYTSELINPNNNVGRTYYVPSVMRPRNLTRSKKDQWYLKVETHKELVNQTFSAEYRKVLAQSPLSCLWIPPSPHIVEIFQENDRPLTPFLCFPSQGLPPFSGFIIFWSFWSVLVGSFSSLPTNLFPSYLPRVHFARELSRVACRSNRMSTGLGPECLDSDLGSDLYSLCYLEKYLEFLWASSVKWVNSGS